MQAHHNSHSLNRRCLVAFTNVGVMTAAQFPKLLKQAGFNVTMMGRSRRRLSVSWNYDTWKKTTDNPKEIIAEIADMVRRDPNAYNWIILSDDLLLRAALDLNLPPEIMTRLSVVRNPDALSILGSKTQTAERLRNEGIDVPPFRICSNMNEISIAAAELGFPVMVKRDRGQNGDGVFKCACPADIGRNTEQLTGKEFQVEKFIDGEQIGVEPLYLDGKLLAFNSARIISADSFAGLETRRQSLNEPALIPILRLLGKVLQLHGFCSLGFMRSHEDGKLYLFEADFRPNAWVTLDKHYGINFASAVRRYFENPTSEQTLQTPTSKNDIRIFYREIEQYIREHRWSDLWHWMTNAENCWHFIPTDDSGFVFRTILRLTLAPGFRALNNKFMTNGNSVQKNCP